MISFKPTRMFIPLLILTLTFLTPLAAQNPITHVSNAPYLQINPDIDGDWIVWYDNRTVTEKHIYLYHIPDSTVTQITSHGGSKDRPRISGNRVVWADHRNGNWDIFNYNLLYPHLGDYPLIDFSGDQEEPDLYGDSLAYIDRSGGGSSSNLYFYNIATANLVQVTNDAMGQQFYPSVSRYGIVYQTGHGNIHLYQFGNQEILDVCTDPAEQKRPVMSGRRIFWEDNRNGNWDIYMFYYFYYTGAMLHLEWPLSPILEQHMVTKPNQADPHIAGDNLVFADDRNGKWDIYMYTFHNKLWGTLVPISAAADDEFGPRASGDRIVWYDDEDPSPSIISQSDVFMWERPPGADLAVNTTDDPDPVRLGNYITYTLAVKNNGPLDATGVVLTDTLSAGVDFFSAITTQGICTHLGGVVTCTIGNLPRDSSVTVTITVNTLLEGRLRNGAAVSGNEIDRVPENNQYTAYTRVKEFMAETLDQGSSPSIAVDSLGRAYICYLSDYWQGNLIYTSNHSGTWQTEILDNSGNIQNPAIAVDMSGKVHIAFAQGDGFSNSLKYIHNLSGVWSAAETVAANAGGCTSVCINVDASGTVHLGYQTSPWSDADIVYLNNQSGSWNSHVVTNQAYNFSSMDVDNDGYAHFSLYNLSMGWGAAYATNAPDGTWRPVEAIEQNWQGGQMESLVSDISVDDIGRPHVSYVGAVQVFSNEDNKYAYKSGGIWTSTIIDNGEYAGTPSAIAVDPNNNVHILYVHGPTRELRYTTNATPPGWEYKYIDEDQDVYDPTSLDIATDEFGKIHICYMRNGQIIYTTNAQYILHYGGGEDGTGGYFYANSTPGASGSPSQPTYEWVDPVSSGHTEITSWTSGDADDGYFGPQAIGFSFSYFDSTYQELFIGTNGYLSFRDGYTVDAGSSILPSVDEPNNFLAACAMDLNVDNALHADAHVYYGGDASRFVITYLHAYDNGSSTDYISFQVILYPNGNIKYQYNNVESTDPFPGSIGNDALVGIENFFGTEGILYRNNGAGGPLFGSPLALMFGKNNLLLPIEDLIHSQVPDKFDLLQNFPNPFNPSTTIRYVLPKASEVEITIFNTLGQKIRTYQWSHQLPGNHQLIWDGRNQHNHTMASGMYFYRLKAGDFIRVKKMLLIR